MRERCCHSLSRVRRFGHVRLLDLSHSLHLDERDDLLAVSRGWLPLVVVQEAELVREVSVAPGEGGDQGGLSLSGFPVE